MSRRRLAGLGLAAALSIAAATAAGTTLGATNKAAAKSITVWLQVDAQSGWPDIVAAANSQFEKDHPGVSVDVQYQTWPTHLQKFDATLAGGSSPDVIEMGNTEMTKYMAAGAFQDITSDKAKFENSKTWLAGLAASGVYGGRIFGVPYYAGTRVVTYRTDLFKQAGIGIPKSLAEYTADAKKLLAKNPKKGFSPVYIAGKDWYVAMSFVFDHGGAIAQQVSGKWKGLLDSPKSIAGLTAYKNFFNAASRASKTTLENNPFPYTVYGQGLAASMLGPTWFTCCVGKKYAGLSGQFVMPSHVKGQVMPSFLGGSDLAVPIGADKALAVDWIKDFTSTSAEKGLQAKGNVPNATNLLNLKKVNEQAALRSWFVPQAKNWVNVENEQILRNMLAQLLTGSLTVKQAATAASDNVASILNAAS